MPLLRIGRQIAVHTVVTNLVSRTQGQFRTRCLSFWRQPRDGLAVDSLCCASLDCQEIFVQCYAPLVLSEQITRLHQLKLLVGIDVAIGPAFVLHFEHLLLQVVYHSFPFTQHYLLHLFDLLQLFHLILNQNLVLHLFLDLLLLVHLLSNLIVHFLRYHGLQSRVHFAHLLSFEDVNLVQLFICLLHLDHFPLHE